MHLNAPITMEHPIILVKERLDINRNRAFSKIVYIYIVPLNKVYIYIYI